MLKRLSGGTEAASGHNPPGLRRHNRRVVLQALRLRGNLSRAELARATGLTPQAIANIVGDLVASGLVRLAGRRRAARGQPPVGLEIAGDGGYAVGLRIDATHYHAVVAGLGGDILDMREGEAPPEAAADWLGFVARLQADITAGLPKERCLGTGLVTPGPFDTAWPGVPSPGAIGALQRRAVAAELSAITGTDVFLENDATAAALGERLYGEARGIDTFFYLFIGEGVGGGIVIGGEPHRGSRGNAGEIGHLIVDPHGPRCYCGNRGCLGEYLSLGARRRSLAKGMDEDAWIAGASEALSIAVAGVENLFDPDAVIIGGAAPPSALRPLVERLGALRASVRQDAEGPRIRLSTLGERSAALGASALPILAATSA